MAAFDSRDDREDQAEGSGESTSPTAQKGTSPGREPGCILSSWRHSGEANEILVALAGLLFLGAFAGLPCLILLSCYYCSPLVIVSLTSY